MNWPMDINIFYITYKNSKNKNEELGILINF